MGCTSPVPRCPVLALAAPLCLVLSLSAPFCPSRIRSHTLTQSLSLSISPSFHSVSITCTPSNPVSHPPPLRFHPFNASGVTELVFTRLLKVPEGDKGLSIDLKAATVRLSQRFLDLRKLYSSHVAWHVACEYSSMNAVSCIGSYSNLRLFYRVHAAIVLI